MPELDENLKLNSNFDMMLDQVKRGQKTIGNKEGANPLIVGPVTLVERSTRNGDFDKLVNSILPGYLELFAEFKKLGVTEVCVHEPSLVLSDTD